jgi:hypothetical protein
MYFGCRQLSQYLNSHSRHPESDNGTYALRIARCANSEINNSQALPTMLKSHCVRHRPTTSFHTLA